MDPMGTDYYMPQEVLVDWGVKWWQEQPELGAEALPEPEWHRFQWPLIQLPSWLLNHLDFSLCMSRKEKDPKQIPIGWQYWLSRSEKMFFYPSGSTSQAVHMPRIMSQDSLEESNNTGYHGNSAGDFLGMVNLHDPNSKVVGDTPNVWG